jgi:SAM-dependent methyltransferase
MSFSSSAAGNGAPEPVSPSGPGDPAQAGQAIYTPFFLAHVYDPLVVRFANRFTWRCPNRAMLDLYDANVSADHLDAGPGTGWYLRHCRFPTAQPHITLVDLNPDVLDVTARRLSRYRPDRFTVNLLEPIDLDGRQFGSIALTHVLHCLPGSMPEKARVFDNLVPLVRPGGTLFGSTILARGVPQSRLARSQIARMNQQQVFDNAEDSLQDLDRALAARFRTYTLRATGSIALFTAVP